jgi:hemoglobin
MPRFALMLILLCPIANSQGKPASLYDRLGRYDAISHIVDGYLKGIRSDPQFSRFSGRGADSLRRAKQLLKDQLCALTGGPCSYIGRDMKTAHSGLGITSDEWSANMKYMAGALDNAKISGKEKTEFLAIIDSLKPAIVETPK